jgi:hypothetical protein
MAWNFERIVQFARQFSDRPAGTELAFVLSEWAAETGLALVNAYPATREDQPPTGDAPAAVAGRVWVRLNGGAWQQVQDVANVTNVGIGSTGVLTGGIASSMVIKAWPAKSIAAGYIVAPGATMDQINADRDTGVALIRTYVNAGDGDDHPLAPDAPFTSGQVTALSAWLTAHGVTNDEFAALFDVSAAQVATWLQGHPRWQFAQTIHDQFGG